MRCVRHHFGWTTAVWGKLIEVSPVENMRMRCMLLARFMLVPGPYLAYMKDETYLERLWRELWRCGACWIGHIHRRTWGWGCSVSKLCVKSWRWFLQVFQYLGWRLEEKWYPPDILYLEKSLRIPAPIQHFLGIINGSLSCTPQVIFRLLLLYCISTGLFVMLSL